MSKTPEEEIGFLDYNDLEEEELLQAEEELPQEPTQESAQEQPQKQLKQEHQNVDDYLYDAFIKNEHKTIDNRKRIAELHDLNQQLIKERDQYAFEATKSLYGNIVSNYDSVLHQIKSLDNYISNSDDSAAILDATTKKTMLLQNLGNLHNQKADIENRIKSVEEQKKAAKDEEEQMPEDAWHIDQAAYKLPKEYRDNVYDFFGKKNLDLLPDMEFFNQELFDIVNSNIQKFDDWYIMSNKSSKSSPYGSQKYFDELNKTINYYREQLANKHITSEEHLNKVSDNAKKTYIKNSAPPSKSRAAPVVSSGNELPAHVMRDAQFYIEKAKLSDKEKEDYLTGVKAAYIRHKKNK